MRTCCQCGAEDREIYQPGEPPLHFVVPEIRYLGAKEDFKPTMQKKGWRPRAFQGRQAMERFICRLCLDTNDLRDRVWRNLRNEAKKLERTNDPDAEYYALLCQ